MQDFPLSHASIKLRAPGALTQAGRQGVGVNARLRRPAPDLHARPQSVVATGQRPLHERDTRSIQAVKGGGDKWWAGLI